MTGVSPSKRSRTRMFANSGNMSSTGVSALSLPRSMGIIAAVLPTALVIVYMRKTELSSRFAPRRGIPGRARIADAL